MNTSPGQYAFTPFRKIPRLNRTCTITEKIDGTNACVHVTEAGDILTGSRNRWITPEDDNFGFAAYVQANRDAFLALGAGTHYGEWYGLGIQRNYGLTEKRFALFNVGKWNEDNVPTGLYVVPTLYVGSFHTSAVEFHVDLLRVVGSSVAPGFMKPEGIIIYHHAAGHYYKVTLDKDDEPKTAQVTA